MRYRYHGYILLKRLFDIVFSILGLIVLFPLFFIMVLVIKLTSKGPVFYRGVRTGQYRILFRVLKFRTMEVDAEKKGGTTTATDDPRVTRIGRFMRRYKIDELPQLFNVLCGDMSIVGPRPEVTLYTQQYASDQEVILHVKPGITDLSSIEFIDLDDRVGVECPDEYFRNNILPVKNELRVQYAQKMTLWGDIKIIVRTAVRLFLKIINR